MDLNRLFVVVFLGGEGGRGEGGRCETIQGVWDMLYRNLDLLDSKKMCASKPLWYTTLLLVHITI